MKINCFHESNINKIIQNENWDSLISYISLHDIAVANDSTILHIAAAHSRVDIMEELLKLGAKTDTKNCFGWTPLMVAAKHGHCEPVELLINAGADVFQKSLYGIDALFLASASGNLRIVHILLCEEAQNCTRMDSLMSPIMIASLNGHSEVVTRLSKIYCVNQFHSKLAGGTKEAAEILLSKGAKVDRRNFAGFSALDISVWFQHKTLSNILRYHMFKLKKETLTDQDDFDIVKAVKDGETELVEQILLQNPENAKVTSENGITLLAIAAELGFDSLSRLLVKSGANIDAQNLTNQRTPLMEAIFHNNRSIAHFLLKAGANINITDKYGRKAIDFANEKYDSASVQQLEFYENLPRINKCLQEFKTNILNQIYKKQLLAMPNAGQFKKQDGYFLEAGISNSETKEEESRQILNRHTTNGFLEEIFKKKGFEEIFHQGQVDWESFLSLTMRLLRKGKNRPHNN